jgi:hypothetical protein
MLKKLAMNTGPNKSNIPAVAHNGRSLLFGQAMATANKTSNIQWLHS